MCFGVRVLFLCVFIIKTKIIIDILMMICCCIVTECGHVTRGRSRVSNPMSCSHWTDWCSAASLALICGCVNSAQTGSTGPETRQRSLQNKIHPRLVFTWRLLKINSKSLKTEKNRRFRKFERSCCINHWCFRRFQVGCDVSCLSELFDCLLKIDAPMMLCLYLLV